MRQLTRDAVKLRTPRLALVGGRSDRPRHRDLTRREYGPAKHGREHDMSVPVLVLLGFTAWTLLTLFCTIGVYRWSRILTGRASIAEWRADLPQGSGWYQRAMRAHMNCVEN